MNRPKSFKLGVDTWIIKYLDIECPDHGETLFDTREIHIITRNTCENQIKNTLLHEVNHVLFEDIFDTITKMTEVSSERVEEQTNRLLTPRQLDVFSKNKALTKYLFNFTK